jgi:predicted nuclease of predicted toxin-antitoxin system
MRFLLDEDLNPAVAKVARGLSLDVLSVHEIDRRGFVDEEQLRFSAAEERVLLTRNRDDFIQLTLRFFQTGDPHAGLLIVPHSLPNHLPERIAHALKRWHDRAGDLGPYFIDFLSA